MMQPISPSPISVLRDPKSRTMPLRERVALLPQEPGVYLYKDAAGTVIYVGKAKNLRARVRNYFTEESLAGAKNGTLISVATSLDYILVDNEKEALALENNLIKQYQPRFNILLRDDKTYPYIKITNEKYPRVYVTRRLNKEDTFYGPYFPGNLAYRTVDLIHRRFMVPSCKIDLTRKHPQPCLEYHIKRCLGPCVEGLTTDEEYAAATRRAKLFLEGKHKELREEIRGQMARASDDLNFERAASLRDLLTTVDEMEERQKMAAASGDDVDIFAYHAEAPLVAVNLFHVRNGRIVDRKEMFWEDQLQFDPQEFIAALLKQIYLGGRYVPGLIHVPAEFEDRELLEEILSEKRGRKVEILTPQRGQKKALAELVGTNAQHSFESRFRILKPSSSSIASAIEEALGLPGPPNRIECFDISHIQGTDKVASMVVWENGRMNKAAYRKFIIKTVIGNDDFASMREVVLRRYSRVLEEKQTMPSLILIDGGLGQLHAAQQSLEKLGILTQPVASIAKREEWIYVLGQEEEPIVLDRHSPVLHLIQVIRDEAHRFAVTFHRTRRNAVRLTSELAEIPGVGKKTVEKLLRTLGSIQQVKAAQEEQLAAVVGPAAARKLRQFYDSQQSNNPHPDYRTAG